MVATTGSLLPSGMMMVTEWEEVLTLIGGGFETISGLKALGDSGEVDELIESLLLSAFSMNWTSSSRSSF